MLRADLHMHSVYSDGTLSVKKLLDYAKSKRLDIIALTDHDSTEGVAEAISYGKEINIKTENNIAVINNKFIMNDNNNTNNVSSNNDTSTLDSLNINSHIFDSKMFNSNTNLNNSLLGISIFVYNTRKNKCK